MKTGNRIGEIRYENESKLRKEEVKLVPCITGNITGAVNIELSS